jgi:hypothetical protein
MTEKLRIGFEVPSGAPADVRLHHLALTGLTQRAGKTTALEGIVSRAPPGLSVLVLLTARGESVFARGRRLAPYFRPRVDWRFVEGLISAHLLEKAKFYRADIINATRGARTLHDVSRAVKRRLKETKNPWAQKVLTELETYLDEILPLLNQTTFASDVRLEPGLNVMDLSGMQPALQQLVVASTVDLVMERRNVLVVLPEAQDFIPEGRGTPAKLSLQDVVRKGARLNVFLLLDSQYLTGLDLGVMRSIGVWLFGRQTLDLELERVAKMVPGRKRSWDEVRSLGLGRFLLVEGDAVRTVYAQPAWLGDEAAVRVAKGQLAAEVARSALKDHPERGREEQMDQKERSAYEERIKDLEERVRSETARAEANAKAAAVNAVDKIRRTPGPAVAPHLDQEGLSNGDPPRTRADVHVFTDAPTLTVHVKEVRIESNEDDRVGQLALLAADGFFDSMKSTGPVMRELMARGWMGGTGTGAKKVVLEALRTLCRYKLLRELKGMFQVIPEAKTRIRVAKEAA